MLALNGFCVNIIPCELIFTDWVAIKQKETKHVTSFRSDNLKPGENIQLFLQGWIGDMMGKGEKKQHNGMFFLTDQRVCFYRKGILGEVLETIPLTKITSVETLSFMGYRILRLHTSHDELAFKTFEEKPLFDEVYTRLEELHHSTTALAINQAAVGGTDIADQIKKLAELREAGILTEDEFTSKKVELLSRM